MTEEKRPTEQPPPQQGHPAAEADPTALLREQHAEALREKEQFRAMAQRAQADLINYKRRAAEEQTETRRNANTQLLLRVLSVADDLDRALAMIPQDAVAPGWLDGLQLLQRSVQNILEAEGVTKIKAEGQAFEPWEHEAVAYEQTSDRMEGMVVRVIRDGYKLRDRVLRPAQVTVSKAQELEDQPRAAQQEE